MTASASAYSALGDGGQPVWRRAAQLRAAIDTRLGKRHADLFAIPQDQGGNIEWRAPFDGAAQSYAELTDAEQRALQSKVQELRPDLERLVERLDSPGRSDGERAFGRLLRQALIAPGPETLFSVDTRPVLAFWGFSGNGTAGTLLGVAAASVATLPAWSAGPTTPPATPTPSAPPAPTNWAAAPASTPPGAAPASQAMAGAPAQAGSPPPPFVAPPATMAAVASPAAPTWWRWMLVALFLLLLLAVAAYVVRPYLPRWVWDGKFTLPPTAGTGPAGSGGVDDSALRAEQAREAALRADFLRLWAQFSEKRNQCTPGQQGTVVPGQGGTVVVPGTKGEGGTTAVPGTKDGTTVDPRQAGPAPKADDATKPPPEARRMPDTKPDPKTDTKTPRPEPKADAKPQPDPKANPKPDPQRPTPQQQAARPTDPRTGQKPGEKPIEPVQIPKEPGVRFMQGDWRSSTDLTTQGGDEVIRPQYTFDKDGKGKSRIVQKNGVVCEGPAQASRDAGGKLIIKETEPLKCSDGTTYAPSTVTCDSGQDGRAQCQGSSEGGPGYAVQLGK